MSTGYERAAAFLDQLSATDREWFLAQLSEDDGDQLRSIIGQNQRSPALQRLHENGKNGKSTSTPELRNAVREINRATVDEVLEVLSDEAPWVTAIIVGCHHWTWTGDVLRGFTESETAVFADLVDQLGQRVKPAMKNLIVERFAARIRAGRKSRSQLGFSDVLARVSDSFDQPKDKVRHSG